MAITTSREHTSGLGNAVNGFEDNLRNLESTSVIRNEINAHVAAVLEGRTTTRNNSELLHYLQLQETLRKFKLYSTWITNRLGELKDREDDPVWRTDDDEDGGKEEGEDLRTERAELEQALATCENECAAINSFISQIPSGSVEFRVVNTSGDTASLVQKALISEDKYSDDIKHGQIPRISESDLPRQSRELLRRDFTQLKREADAKLSPDFSVLFSQLKALQRKDDNSHKFFRYGGAVDLGPLFHFESLLIDDDWERMLREDCIIDEVQVGISIRAIERLIEAVNNISYNIDHSQIAVSQAKTHITQYGTKGMMESLARNPEKPEAIREILGQLNDSLENLKQRATLILEINKVLDRKAYIESLSYAKAIERLESK